MSPSSKAIQFHLEWVQRSDTLVTTPTIPTIFTSNHLIKLPFELNQVESFIWGGRVIILHAALAHEELDRAVFVQVLAVSLKDLCMRLLDDHIDVRILVDLLIDFVDFHLGEFLKPLEDGVMLVDL